MKKIILLLILAGITGGAFAQGGWTNPNPGAYGARAHRLSADSTLFFPTGCGAPVLHGYNLKMSAVYYDSCAGKMYAFDPSGAGAWAQVGSGGGAGADTSIYKFDGRIVGNRIVNAGNHNLTFDSLASFNLKGLTSGLATDSALVINPVNGRVRYKQFPSGGVKLVTGGFGINVNNTDNTIPFVSADTSQIKTVADAKKDSIALAALANSKVANVFRKAGTDSVFQVINSVSIYAFKDSTGGSGSTPSLQQVTDVGVTTNHAIGLLGAGASKESYITGADGETGLTISKLPQQSGVETNTWTLVKKVNGEFANALGEVSIPVGISAVNANAPLSASGTTTKTISADTATTGVGLTTLYQNSLKLNKTDTTNKWVNSVVSVNDSTIRVFKGTGSTDLLIRGSGGAGGFIPLSGTVSGDPVMGDIELDVFNQGPLKIYSQFSSELGADVEFTDDGFINLRSKAGGFTGFAQMTSSSFTVNSNDSSSHGITGNQDFTHNITDLDYVQKKYVDNKVRLGIRTISDNYTVADDDYTISCQTDPSPLGTIAITIPSGQLDGRILIIKRFGADDVGVITITSDGSSNMQNKTTGAFIPIITLGDWGNYDQCYMLQFNQIATRWEVIN